MLAGPRRSIRWLIVALALASSAPAAFAQDVEMLGRRYGTQPPATYFQELARNPTAYRFGRGRASTARMLEAARAVGSGAALRAPAAGGPPLLLGPRGHVVGTYSVPLLLGLFSNSPATGPYTRVDVQQAYFDAPTGTVTEYYDEVSGGDLNLVGVTRDWVRSVHSQTTVAQGQSGLICCGIGNFIKDLISLQTGVNWGAFDNDGPDGSPNSGDDDGYVDALAVMHPLRGAECGGAGGGDRIWSHKWTLSDASETGPYVTTSPRHPANGGFIRIEDYFVQGALSCDQTSLNEIGVFAHETGHAFGLPDLYDTRSSGSRHNGTGNWDVMGHGTWGCNNNTPQRPCHMGAWSKAMLGWVDVNLLAADTDHGTLTLPPVETSQVVYRVDAADGSGEYFLIENRQRIGYDQGLFEEGLLIWQIDHYALLDRWGENLVNAASHMAVRIREADGFDQLAGPASSGAKGDAGDPFPGQTGNSVFHAASTPTSNSFPGTPTGLTLVGIATAANGTDVSFRALTRFTRLTVRSTGSSGGGLFTVDGAPLPGPPPHVVASAPFTSRTIEAATGDIIQPGERRPFVQWTDAPSAPRSRTVTTPIADTDYEASYGALQYQLAIPLTGGINGVAPGTVVTTPSSADLWFTPSPAAIQVSIATTTGFAFLGWTGELAGQQNPTSVVLDDAPIFGGADFQLTYDIADVDLTFDAATPQDIQLVATDGTQPITWSVVTGSLPTGIGLSTQGRVLGAALEAGAFPVTVEAEDGIGLTVQATIDFDVTELTLSWAELASHFLLAGPALGQLREAYVDHHGNGDGTYDLGDFRAWVLAHPTLPLSAAVVQPQPSVLIVPTRTAARRADR